MSSKTETKKRAAAPFSTSLHLKQTKASECKLKSNFTRSTHSETISSLAQPQNSAKLDYKTSFGGSGGGGGPFHSKLKIQRQNAIISPKTSFTMRRNMKDDRTITAEARGKHKKDGAPTTTTTTTPIRAAKPKPLEQRDEICKTFGIPSSPQRAIKNGKIPQQKTPAAAAAAVCESHKRQDGNNNAIMNSILSSSSKSPRIIQEEEKGLSFIVPLEPFIQVVEGSELELWVKIKGAERVVWVKNDELIPHDPPTQSHSSNPREGSYSLRIGEVALSHSAIYVCEAYGREEKEDTICWTTVQVVENIGDTEEAAFPPRLIVPPIIITSMEEEDEGAGAGAAATPPQISGQVDEDALENICEEEEDAEPEVETRVQEEEVAQESPASEGRQSSTESEEASSSCSYLGSFRDSLGDAAAVAHPLSPRVLMGPSNLILMVGERAVVRVKIWAPEELPLSITWAKLTRGSYKALPPSPNLSITQPTLDLLSLSIPSVSYEDCGKYRVKIANASGAHVHHCLISVEGAPEPPPPPTPTLTTSPPEITVSWSCVPFDGGSALLGYILEEMKMKSGGGGEASPWIVITTPNFKGLCHKVKEPLPSHTYYFRVCAENSHGRGKYSKTSEGIRVPPAEGEGEDKNPHTLRKKSSSLSSEDAPPYIYKDVPLQHREFLEDYEKHEQLGKGRFGVVFKVTNKEGQVYAGKFLKCRKSSDKERAALEYKIMNELKFHPKLICLVEAYEMSREFVLVMELISGGELFERVVADDFTLTERDCVAFLRQLCDGAKYIHDKNIMHLDLKPENILCTEKRRNRIKIIDFGLAQYYNPDVPLRVLFGTAEFVSPEIINYETISPATDMWAVGVITYILLSGLSPFLGDDDNETFSNITRGEYDFEDEAFLHISPEGKDFISNLLLKRKEKRMTAEECLEHRWLALSEAEKKDIVLPTDKLKRFLLRRKWQKTGNAIRALGRITTLYSSSRRSSSNSSTGNRTLPESGSLDEEDSVFIGGGGVGGVGGGTERVKYDENCRSDSGIGGDSSGHFSLE